MKRIFLLPLLAIAIALGVSAQNSKTPDAGRRQYQVFGVAFYNLENLFDTINNNGTYDLEYSPAGAKKWNGKKYWSKIANLARGVDVGALYNERYFKFINVSNTPLIVEGKPEFRTRDQMCVTGRMGIDTVSIIVNHWPSRLGGQEQSSPLREAAAYTSKLIADSIWALRPNEGIMVMGDLNDDPYDKSCAKVLGAAKKQKGVGAHGFFNPFWSLLDQGIGTLAYNSSWNLFDQIILSGSLLEQNSGEGRLHFWKAKVNNFDFLKDKEGNRQGYPLRTFASGMYLNGYSDHFPTEVLLRRTVVRKR